MPIRLYFIAREIRSWYCKQMTLNQRRRYCLISLLRKFTTARGFTAARAWKPQRASSFLPVVEKLAGSGPQVSGPLAVVGFERHARQRGNFVRGVKGSTDGLQHGRETQQQTDHRGTRTLLRLTKMRTKDWARSCVLVHGSHLKSCNSDVTWLVKFYRSCDRRGLIMGTFYFEGAQWSQPGSERGGRLTRWTLKERKVRRFNERGVGVQVKKAIVPTVETCNLLQSLRA